MTTSSPSPLSEDPLSTSGNESSTARLSVLRRKYEQTLPDPEDAKTDLRPDGETLP